MEATVNTLPIFEQIVLMLLLMVGSGAPAATATEACQQSVLDHVLRCGVAGQHANPVNEKI